MRLRYCDGCKAPIKGNDYETLSLAGAEYDLCQGCANILVTILVQNSLKQRLSNFHEKGR